MTVAIGRPVINPEEALGCLSGDPGIMGMPRSSSCAGAQVRCQDASGSLSGHFTIRSLGDYGEGSQRTFYMNRLHV